MNDSIATPEAEPRKDRQVKDVCSEGAEATSKLQPKIGGALSGAPGTADVLKDIALKIAPGGITLDADPAPQSQPYAQSVIEDAEQPGPEPKVERIDARIPDATRASQGDPGAEQACEGRVMDDGLLDQIREAFGGVQCVAKTPQQLIEDAETLKPGNDDALMALMGEAVAARLNPAQLGTFFRALKGSVKRPLEELRVCYEHARRAAGVPTKEQEDKARELRDEVLRLHENSDHITRSVARDFWVFDKTHWKRRIDDQIGKFVSETFEGMKNNKGVDMTSVVDKAIKLLKWKCQQLEDEFGFTTVPRPIINVRNGEIHINPDGTINFHEGVHNPKNYQTYVLQTDYSPDAQCEVYEEALAKIFQHKEGLVRHWNEFVGYAIQAHRNIPSIWLLHGEGENGKSKLAETIYEHLMDGDSAAAIDVRNLDERFQISMLFGKLIGFDDDVNKDTRLPDGILKRLSETKRMTGEFKGKDHFGFTSYSLIMMLCNGWPKTSDVSHGMTRRVQCIPFRKNFEKTKNKKLFPHIWKHELAGVLNLSLAGLKRVRERDSEFDPPPECIEAKMEWLATANPVQAFISEEFVKSPGSFLPREGTYKHYEEWMQHNGLKMPVGRNHFYKMLEQLKIELVKKKDGLFYWKDITVRDAPMNTHYRKCK